MGKPELLELISSFPEDKLEEIVLASVREIFFSGDWGTANAMAEYILNSGSNDMFKGKIAGFEIFMAVRARNARQALDRFTYLEMLEQSDKLPCLKADGLADLSDLLLADDAPLLSELWQKSLQPNLPRHIQKKYARIGELLCRQFLKSHADQECLKVALSMKNNLDPGIYEKNCPQIKNLKKK